MADELKLFRCYLCKKYKMLEERNEIWIEEMIIPKEICEGCKKQILESSVAKQADAKQHG